MQAAITIVYGELQTDPAVPHGDLFEMLVECLPPDLMLDPNVICNVPLYQAARELLRMLGHTTPVEDRVPARKAVIMLLYANYTDTQKGMFMSAYDSLTSISRGSPPQAMANQPRPNGARGAPEAAKVEESRALASSRKVAESFARRLQDHQKYSGAPDSDLELAFSLFSTCMSDNAVPETDAIKFAHNMFTGEARRFYTSSSSALAATSVSELKEILIDRFISPAAQSAISRELDSLSVAQKMAKDHSTPREALDSIYNLIVKKGPLAEVQNRSDRALGNYLRKSVLSERWSLVPAQEFTADPEMTFADLHQALISAILSEEEAAAARARAFAETASTHYLSEDTDRASFCVNTMYGGQYNAARKSHGNVHQQPRRSSNERATSSASNTLRCFRCNQPGHFARQCRSGPSFTEAVKARLKNKCAEDSLGNVVSSTLLDLTTQLDQANESPELDEGASSTYLEDRILRMWFDDMAPTGPAQDVTDAASVPRDEAAREELKDFQ